jgi:diaminopimelate decarboxylase
MIESLQLETSPIPIGLLPDTARVNGGSLTIAGCSLEDLTTEFGTPLYVYDEMTLRREAQQTLRAFSPLGARVSFAGKACGALDILRVFREEGLDLDVVSAGELEAGIRAGFLPSQLHLHGNCKSDEELNRATHLGIHAIVVDNCEELQRLSTIAHGGRRTGPSVQVRLQLPLEAETHPHLRTAGCRSKFGVALEDLDEMLSGTAARSGLQINGVHAHLGSQIGDAAIYGRAASQLIEIARTLKERGFPCREASIGGGWRVAYSPRDRALAPSEVAQEVRLPFAKEQWLRPAVEPGRALVARAALALYRVGSVKRYGRRRIVAVDGGMGDNPRPALYGSAYHAIVPARILEEPVGEADVVGRYCESGDVLASDVGLPPVAAGELVCVPVSGAYQLSMASSYNLVPQPAVVMVRDGNARVILRRGTMNDLFTRETSPR